MKFSYNELNISSKLFAFLLLPLITLLFFVNITVSEKQQQLKDTQNTLNFTYIAQKLSEIAYQLQKERGLSAGTIGSDGNTFQKQLTQQREQSDLAIKKLSLQLVNRDGYIDEEYVEQIAHLAEEFKQLTSTRITVDRHIGDSFFSVYTHIITDTLNAASLLQNFNHENNAAFSYLNILWLEEYSGLERGSLNGALTSKKMSPKQHSNISRYIAAQDAELSKFFRTADGEQQARVHDILAGDSATTVEHYRKDIFNRAERNDALNGLQALIGFGGFIHDFKNYVIRGDKKYKARVRQQIEDINTQIEVYRSLPFLDHQEESALDTIQETLQQYQNHLDVIAAMSAGKIPILEIDKMVKVDDQPAIDAINLLRSHLSSQDPEDWWLHATNRIDGFHEVSLSIVDNLIHLSQQKEFKTRQLLYLYLIVTITILLLSGFIGFKLRSRLVNEIKYIANTMRTSKKTQQLLTVRGSDEIAEMAHEFNVLITERTATEESLRLLARVFSDTHEGITITNSDQIIIDVNPAFCDITGFSREEVIGKNPSILSSGKQGSEFYQGMWQQINEQGHWKGEVWNRKKGGEIYAELLTISVLKDELDNVVNYVGVFTDITSSKQQQEQLSLMAHYDVLTGLPNRALFVDRFTQAIAHSKRTETLLAIFFVDLDKFKPVNDNYGHEVGDKLLIEVAQRITANIREEDTVSRQGGDEFAILLGDIKSISESKKMAQRIHHSLSLPYSIDGHTISIGASSGITLYPLEDADLDTLMRYSDQAMYQAKLAGRNCYHLFDHNDDHQAIQKQNKLQELERALADNEFHLYYQPKVNMVTGDVFGAEALIRWIHPEKGLIPPLDFLPTLEGTELEIKVGNWVINQALSQLDDWYQQGLKLEVSVNISSHHLLSETFFTQLDAALAKHPSIDSQCLQLEILESSALGDLNAISTIIKTCQGALGIKVALDDFGTGYSSLTHLRNLPVDTIKIDQSFVRDMLNDPNDSAIIDGIIGLSDSFNREVIAEGVETTNHGIMLILVGCEQAQGYGIAKPMPANDFPQWLNNYIPNQEWLQCGNKHRSIKENKIKLFRLVTEHWKNTFINNIQSLPDRAEHWPILNGKHCPCGTWIKRARQEQLFEAEGLEQLDKAHDALHLIAQEFHLQYQDGDVNTAREGLLELQVAFDNMNYSLGMCE